MEKLCNLTASLTVGLTGGMVVVGVFVRYELYRYGHTDWWWIQSFAPTALHNNVSVYYTIA